MQKEIVEKMIIAQKTFLDKKSKERFIFIFNRL
jgi:hypothetical protein